jgi:hypothetical protein
MNAASAFPGLLLPEQNEQLRLLCLGESLFLYLLRRITTGYLFRRIVATIEFIIHIQQALGFRDTGKRKVNCTRCIHGQIASSGKIFSPG